MFYKCDENNGAKRSRITRGAVLNEYAHCRRYKVKRSAENSNTRGHIDLLTSIGRKLRSKYPHANLKSTTRR